MVKNWTHRHRCSQAHFQLWSSFCFLLLTEYTSVEISATIWPDWFDPNGHRRVLQPVLFLYKCFQCDLLFQVLSGIQKLCSLWCFIYKVQDVLYFISEKYCRILFTLIPFKKSYCQVLILATPLICTSCHRSTGTFLPVIPLSLSRIEHKGVCVFVLCEQGTVT